MKGVCFLYSITIQKAQDFKLDSPYVDLLSDKKFTEYITVASKEILIPTDVKPLKVGSVIL